MGVKAGEKWVKIGVLKGYQEMGARYGGSQ